MHIFFSSQSRLDRSVRCKHMYVNASFPLTGGLIKQTTAAADWSLRLQRTDRDQCAVSMKKLKNPSYCEPPDPAPPTFCVRFL